MNINLEIGGFVVKLVCHDPALHRRIQAAFTAIPSPIRKSAPDLRRPQSVVRPPVTLTVYPPETVSSSTGHSLDLSSGKLLDGEGEYVATFDFAARRGFIRLTSAPDRRAWALAGFIRRIFTRLVIDHNGAVFHSACIVRASAAYLFFGKSGAGKSTVCELSPSATIASDDLTVVRAVNGRLLAWGLPAFAKALRRASPPSEAAEPARHWRSDQDLAAFGSGSKTVLSNGPFPITAAFTLVQDKSVYIKRLGAATAFAGMLAFPADLTLPGRSLPPLRLGKAPLLASAEPSAKPGRRDDGRRSHGEPEEQVGKTVDLLIRLVHNVPCCELHFRKDRGFWNEIDAVVHSPQSTVDGK